MANELMNTFDSGTDIVTRASFNSRIEQANTNFVAGNTELLGAMPNKNLLHNWDFRNPVNQRGQSSYSGLGYTVDRWRLNGGTLILGSGGVKFPAGYVLYNISEKSYDTTKLYTFSYLDGNDNVHSAVIDTFGIYHLVDSKLSVQISGAVIYLESKDSDNIIKAVKLELGSVSTLANDPPADYGEQLALCQRYLSRITLTTRYRASLILSNEIHFLIPLPVTMRGLLYAPTFVSGTASICAINSITAQSGFTLTYSIEENGIAIVATKTSHGLSDAILQIADAIFSVDL